MGTCLEKNQKPIRFFIGAIAAFLILFAGCASAPKEIPEDLSVPELTQRAQSALDANNYKAAEAYYQAILDRYPNDMDAVCSAEFEIAHLRIKKKNWSDAYVRLSALLTRYENDAERVLPREYRRLAEIDMEKIPDSFRTADK